MHSNIVLKAKKYIENLLKDFDKKGYYFHNLDHSLDVFKRSSYLAIQEGINEELREIVELAALFHDSGFTKQYDKNEAIGAEIAEKWLKENNYPKDKIDIIKQTILVTIPGKKPKNKLEEIIKDADFDNLGRDDFFQKFIDLKKEVLFIKENIDPQSWFEKAKEFIMTNDFFTATQIKERQEKWEENKSKLKNILYLTDLEKITK